MKPQVDTAHLDSAAANYLLPQSTVETERLLRQARLLHNPSTRWLFARAGLTAGMRVLDVGTGAGDVALIAAEFVGPTGCVVGIDTSAAILETARARAARAGLTHVHFIEGDLHDPPLEGVFDAVVGRSVLAHQADSSAALRGLLRSLEPGGLVAFREVDSTFGMFTAFPPSPTLELLSTAMQATAKLYPRRAAPASVSPGFSLARIFREAGLPFPELFADSVAGGAPGWEGYTYLADMARLFNDVITRVGLPIPTGLEDPAAFARKVESEVVAAGGIVKLQDAVNAWVRAPR